MASSDENARELCRREERLFGQKANLDALNQELALNFYPERADFTLERALGEEFAIDLFDSAPLYDRRDLGNARASMLRPRGQQWAKAGHTDDDINELPHIARFFDRLNKLAFSRIYQSRSGFVKAEKEADQDIVTFGNAVKTVEAIRDRQGTQRLLERCWHLRDVVWLDDAYGVKQDFVARRFKASARHIKQQFPDAKLHDSIIRALEKEPDTEFKLCHIMMLADEYDYYQKPNNQTAQYASIYYDSEHKMLLRERPSERFRYVINKWQTISGTQYAVSPAAISSLSDARGLQTMARVLLEAGEKALDPPLKGTQGAVKSDVDQSAGRITWVDKDYDEKMGPAIELLLPQGVKPNIGIELINRTTLALKDGWYLTKLTLPQQAKTAYETAQLVEEFVRANIPLFEPWEAGVEDTLEEIYGVLMDINEFGSVRDWPQELSGADLEFVFSNPLQDAKERNKVNQSQQVLGVLAGAMQIDPNAAHAVDVIQMVRDVTRGTGAPADWLPDDDATKQKVAAAQQAGNILGALNTAGQAADVANSGLDAAQKLQDLTRPAVDQSATYGPT